MASSPKSRVRPKNAAAFATPWFAVLERARLTNNRRAAIRARRELRLLGVAVRFVETTRRSGEVHDAG
jgi:hypothetical protein